MEEQKIPIIEPPMEMKKIDDVKPDYSGLSFTLLQMFPGVGEFMMEMICVRNFL